MRIANRISEFVLLSVSGSCKVRVIDPDGKRRVYELSDPGIGLYVPRMVWKEMYDFSRNCVLMVLCSKPYDAGEYIRDFDEFVRECGEEEHPAEGVNR